MKKINLLLRKCKSLSRQLGRSSSYSNLRSNSSREDFWVSDHDHHQDQDHRDHVMKTTTTATPTRNATIFVGSSRKRYVISTKYLSHPLLAALLEKSKVAGRKGNDDVLVVKCEVVLFDHLLWMLENADPVTLASDSLEELAALYVF
ncbi:auxin-responsive protein SAUR76 [Humulus lupulus]|uniref:auxin-responsive protein SAUR76 n=1 Tax=Humulus lupulus TaxID=3486 RepID=UPI002B40364A|nr:auxin-responsive protein SAUR76 [Humulus lupulus]